MTEVEERQGPVGRRHPRGLSDAEVLLCGTGSHIRGSRLTDISAVRTTLTDLRDVLVERCGAKNPRVQVDPENPKLLGRAINGAAGRTAQVLLLYYVGHGLVDPNGNLFLATAETDPRPGELELTALPYEIVRQFVNASPAEVKIVILDCCYSGIAVGNLGDDAAIANRAAIEGAYVLTSAGRDQASIAPPKARHTAFSGALIHLLADGDRDIAGDLTLGAVFRYLDHHLPAAGYPRPAVRTTGGADGFVLTDNPAAGGDAGRQRQLPPPRRRVRIPVILAAALAGTAAVPFLASFLHGGDGTGPPPGVRGDILRDRWGLLLLAATAVATVMVTAGPVAHGMARVAGRYQRRHRHRRRLLRRLQVTLHGLLAFLLAVASGGVALTAGAGARVWLATCPTTVRVGVLVSADSQEPARELAQAFERDTAEDNFGCPDARLLVYAADAAQIRTALVNGWGSEEHVQIGPRPDVWLPDWSGETRDARATAGRIGRELPIAEIRTVASTPLVLAVATPSVAAEDELVDTASWPQLLDTMRRRGWATVVPDPDTTVGGLARVPLYHPPAGPDVPDSSPRTVEKHIERSFDRGRHPLGADVGALLCGPGGVRDRTGYVVTEQAVARFNHGDPFGVDCPRPDPVRLRAVYPAETPRLDRDVVRFDWTGVGEQQTRAAARFTAWLAGPDGAAALTAAGLRTPDGAPGAPLSSEWGVQPDLTPPPTPISVDLVQDVHTRYAEAHRAGRVLIAIDASGSMGLAAPGGSLWRVAARDAERSLGQLGPRDEWGIWAFQGAQRDGVRELVPIGRRDDPVRGRSRKAAAAEALAGVRPAGPAPLFSTIVAGVAETGPTTDERVTALVLLTDGQNDNASAIGARQFRTAVSRKGVRVFAVAMGATGCAAPVLRTVTTATGGTCLEADADGVVDQLDTIMQAVL